MKTAVATAVAFVAAFAAVNVATAQRYAAHNVGYVPYARYHHASTWEQGVLDGYAELNRAIGQRNYYNSLANINNQQAYSAAIDNDLKRTDAYFAKRQMNREAVAAEQRPRITQQEAAQLAKNRLPARLATHQYNESIGTVVWPAALDGEAFAAEREEISVLMADRTLGEAGVGTQNHEEINALVASLKDKLRSNIGQMSPSKYVAAKKFLTSLEYESRFAPGTSGLAAR